MKRKLMINKIIRVSGLDNPQKIAEVKQEMTLENLMNLSNHIQDLR